MAGLETVYAIHAFEAENDDEIAFSVGEPIIVLEKDDGYNDGWWQGRNVRGEIGLFPMNYTTTKTPDSSPSLENKIDSLEHDIYRMQLGSADKVHTSFTSHHLPTPSTSSSTKVSRDPLPRVNSFSSLDSSSLSHSTSARHLPHSTAPSKTMQQTLEITLSLPTLSHTAPEDWSMDQVAFWLSSMGFADHADNFKAQEITGDILLELTADSLKELDIKTFGKRFKIHNAICALRNHVNHQTVNHPSGNRPREHASKSNPLLATTPTLSNSSEAQRPLNDHSEVDSGRVYDEKLQTSRLASPKLMPYADDDLVSDYSTVIRNSTQTFRPTSPVYPRTYTSPGSIQSDQPSRPNYSYSVESFTSSPPVHHPIADRPTTTLIQKSTSNRNPSATASLPSAFFEQSNLPSSIPSAAKSRYSSFKKSLLMSTSRPQTVLPVASRASADYVAQRMGFSDGSVTPDMEGWLHKRSDKYKTWNKRWFVLKGPNLFYFKSPKDVRMKGIINLRGYKIVADESIYPGKYCFKVQHERERTFYFYTHHQASLKAWISALLKATISRDMEAPVMSSSTIPTVPLEVARRMKPRPPSVLLYNNNNKDGNGNGNSSNKENQAHHTSYRPTPIDTRPFSASREELSQPIMRASISDDTSRTSLHMLPQTPESGITLASQYATPEPNDVAPQEPRPAPQEYRLSVSQTSHDYFSPDEDEDLIDPHHDELLAVQRPGGLRRLTEESHLSQHWHHSWTVEDYLSWINQNISSKITDLNELRTGDILIDLLENLSGKQVRRPPTTNTTSVSMQMLDNIVAAFKFMGREGVTVDGRYTIKDVFSGNEEKMMEMLDAIKSWADTLDRPASDKKMASGGTFGEEDQGKLKALDGDTVHV
ncbi:uncharacterized protein BYT42DRAFT_532078 [Radiomyces spectabilis]|uniref:uncharacterized protein n=1 Tax=Radiomyces spectabilis TaxID=64574 RepID=UPI00221F5A6C|nr:uncharacterized protein BYT42DRAFT_532078 [Radiomyces spectabilis]KAI8379361.1 hypothetical protein BYT42DRAFT_532078 [Radiomyces spectabilis]